MTPPPTAALALLGGWALLTLWATTTVAAAQSRADDDLEIAVPEPQRDRSDDRSTTDSSRGSFSAADD
ncbi:hypothetical protein [Natrinema salsiterrestre]|uniref:Uncharacterized protein n=1 Tax=Natrinema salsiterrestre TaxID=2950540 RepID=A0A9Q4PZB9_9EURY|nr:hypothetical protein [Natrinema salsiterrestre]MDF9744600.1 hypothetical protein [Natrinema salsiterrestre]